MLLTGAPGSGKSDMVLRLVDRGFMLVADDQVDMADGWASAPLALAGILEVRGLGLLKLEFGSAPVVLVVALQRGDRLPLPCRYEILNVPMVSVDPSPASAPLLIERALDAVQGKGCFVTGAFG